MGNTATFKLVKGELNSTLQNAQNELSAFLADTTQLALLDSCINLINQIRGTFIIIEDKGATLLCEELGKLLNELPLEDFANNTPKGEKLKDTITQGLIFIGRYLEFLEVNSNSAPELLLPEINQLRKGRGLSLLKDSHFYPFKLGAMLKPRSSFPFYYDDNTLVLLKRYRQMYQAAFLKLLQGYRTHVSLKYMTRAISQIDKLSSNTKVAPIFWVATAVLDVLAHQKSDGIGKNRKLVFSALDKQIKFLIDKGELGFKTAPLPDLMKELLFILKLNQGVSPLADKIVSVYKLPACSITESELAEQRLLLSSPGHSVMQSVSVALNEEILQVKQMVDQAAVGEVQDFSAIALSQSLNKIADILNMVGLSSPSNVLKKQSKLVGAWTESRSPEVNQLMSIADAVLYAESAVSRIQQGGVIGDSLDHVESAARAQLHSAHMALIDESQSGIVMAKRAIAAFIESKNDKLHLNTVHATLDAVRGAMFFIGSPEAANILKLSIDFIDSKLINSDEMVDVSILEGLADALSSLEFFLESMLNEAGGDLSLLKLANEAVENF